MKVEHITVSGRPMVRLTLNGAIRTSTAPQALAALGEAIQVEHVHLLQLQREEAEARHQVKLCIGRGENATAARAAATRLQADAAGAAKQIARLEELVESLHATAIEIYAAPLRQQHEAAMAEALAHLPAIPAPITLENHHAC